TGTPTRAASPSSRLWMGPTSMPPTRASSPSPRCASRPPRGCPTRCGRPSNADSARSLARGGGYVELADERTRPTPPGDHRRRPGAAGDGDVEDTSLLLAVLGQTVRHQSDTGVPHDDMGPLGTLGPVDS